MKKNLFTLAILTIFGAAMAFAQPRAIGGRIGGGLDFSYEHGLGSGNMVSIEAGVPLFSTLEVAATYDWIDPFGATVPWEEKGEWHWYMGVGGVVATNFNFNAAFIGAAGRFGIEYDFWFPLQLSIDWRPALGAAVASNAAAFGHDLYAGALGLGVRYKF